MRKRILIVVTASALFGVSFIAWALAGLPPVRFILRYGLSSGCEPTGEMFSVEGVEFVEIGPGIFRMGSDYLAEGGDWIWKLCAPFGLPWGKMPEPSDEMPVHWVEFHRGYWIATTEVTNAQYERFEPGHQRSEDSKGDDDPVVLVSWEDATRYCAWLSEKADRPIRLPSEAEWECACRAGSNREFCFGDDGSNLGKYAWFAANSEDRAHQVATKRPNRWGLYDLHGNVWEWCEDSWRFHHDRAPTDGSAWTEDNEAWTENIPRRISRGGGWTLSAGYCRSAVRDYDHPAYRVRILGFRPAISTPDD